MFACGENAADAAAQIRQPAVRSWPASYPFSLAQLWLQVFVPAMVLVQELFDAADAVHDAVKAMKSCKEDARKISRLALEIATSVQNTAAAARHSGEATDLGISVAAALGATRDVFVQCANFMRDVAGRSPLIRNFKRGLTAEIISGYLATIEGLHALLKVRDHFCGLMLEPFTGLGVNETSSKASIDASIRAMNATYDGLKSTLNVMVNISDGLPWPLKAVPQTFLYILRLFEDCQDIRPKILSLLYRVQKLWVIVERVSQKISQPPEGELLHYLSGFFETLQRIAIRLYVVLRVGRIKRAMAIHTICACLDLEKLRLDDAREDISLLFQTETFAQVYEMNERVGQQAVALSFPLVSNMSVSTSLPPKPIFFHGRDGLVHDAVGRLTGSGTTARLAVLGTGGMGKTAVALAILHDPRVVEHLRCWRLFLSCEALVDADSIVVSLAKLLRLPSSTDLLTAVLTHLRAVTRMLLVLDNLETVWLVGGAPATAVEELLGRLAQIPSLSLMITCRGTVLPESVEWSNVDTAALEPFSIDAAVQTFRDRAGRRFAPPNEDIVRELLDAVDRMPLAVSLLGQLARRGISVSELLERWNRERSALLRTHGSGRINNVEISMGISIAMLLAADKSLESLQLLSVCCMLPDGLRPEVFERLRSQFNHIDRARDTLSAYALAILSTDGVLTTLSPIRHYVLEHHPSVFMRLGDQNYVAQTARFLGTVRRKQGDFALAEQLLGEAEVYYKGRSDLLGIAVCAEEFGYLRHEQQRLNEAVDYFRFAHGLYEALHVREKIQNCYEWIEFLEPTCLSSAVCSK